MKIWSSASNLSIDGAKGVWLNSIQGLSPASGNSRAANFIMSFVSRSEASRCCFQGLRSGAESAARQQRLYFLPLPHGHSAFLPTLAREWEGIWRHYRAENARIKSAFVEEKVEIAGEPLSALSRRALLPGGASRPVIDNR
ncbi:MAG TPA: hypothetical protein VLZ50_01855 [Terracidiphilus sp.]|nr:hypothetical protein [Terracidiphilus sp.]